jgi:hypothetical protein
MKFSANAEDSDLHPMGLFGSLKCCVWVVIHVFNFSRLFAGGCHEHQQIRCSFLFSEY